MLDKAQVTKLREFTLLQSLQLKLTTILDTLHLTSREASTGDQGLISNAEDMSPVSVELE
jgi:hypothetical protein